MRYRAAEKLEIIRLVEQSSLPVRRTLAQLGIPRSTFYAWYERYLARGAGALEDGQPAPRRVWNKLPDTVAQAVVGLALKEPELSPRELAVAFVDQQQYFVSEASVYRLAEGTRPDHQPRLHPDEGGRPLRPADHRAQSALADRLHLPAGDRLGLVLPVDRARRLLALHPGLEAVHHHDRNRCLRHADDGPAQFRVGARSGPASAAAAERQRAILPLRPTRFLARRAWHDAHPGQALSSDDPGQDRALPPLA